MVESEGREFSLRESEAPLPAPPPVTGVQRMGAVTEFDERPDRVDLREYLRIILYHKWYVIFVVLAVSAGVGYLVYRMPDKYRATTTVLRKSGGGANPAKFLGLGGMGGSMSGDMTMETLGQMVKQRPVLERIRETLVGLPQASAGRLRQLSGVKTEDKDPLTQEEKERLSRLGLGDIELALSVDSDASEQLLHIVAVSPDSAVPAILANTAAEALQSRLEELKQTGGVEEEQQIQDLLATKKKELQDLEDEVFDQKKRISDMTSGGQAEPGAGAFTGEVTALLDALRRNQAMLEGEKLQAQAMEQQISGLRARIQAEPEKIVVESTYQYPLRNRLVDLRMRRQQLLTQFTPDHPQIRSLEREIQASEEMLQRAEGGDLGAETLGPNPVRSNLESQLAQLEIALTGVRARQKVLEDTVANLSGRLGNMDQRELLKLEALKGRQQVLAQVLVHLEQQLQTARIAKAGGEGAFQPVEDAIRPTQPFAPNRGRYLLLGILTGLILGFGAAFLLEALDDTVKSTTDVVQNLRVTPLGVVPDWKRREDVLINPDSPKSGISEVFGVLRNNIRHASVHKPEKRLLIASSLQGEGKSVIAANLAISYALEGNKTFLIDIDLRKARKHILTEVVHVEGTPTVGLSDYLDDRAKLQEIIYPTTMEGLFYIPSGSQVPNPARLLRSGKLVELLDMLEKKLDVVVIDAPAILPVVDTSLVAVHVRGVVMVVQAEETPIPVAKQGLDRLKHINAPLLGCVVNRASGLSLKHFYYYYRSGKYYDETK